MSDDWGTPDWTYDEMVAELDAARERIAELEGKLHKALRWGVECAGQRTDAHDRERRLVEALRSLHAWGRCFVEDTPITAETLWRAFPAAVKRAGEVLADHPYDTPAEMPADCHPQGE